MADLKTTIPKGALVLVTGATGFVGSHLTKQLLERGYRVRGTVRDLSTAQWLRQGPFKPFVDSLELVPVPDLGADHAYDAAVKGVSAIAHVASVVTFSPDPYEVVPATVRGAVSLLQAALREPAVRAFVYTSSIVAAATPVLGVDAVITRDSWNEDALRAAWAPPPYEPARGRFTYMASKVEAERAVWRFVEEHKPSFTVSSVNPSSIIGEPLHPKHSESPVAYIKFLWDGDASRVLRNPSVIEVDVKDVALLHVAALLDAEADGARIQAWAHPCTWNDALAIMRKLYPQHKFPPDFPPLPLLGLSTDLTQPLALLEKWGPQDGWKSLEETIADNLRPIEAWGYQN